MPTCGRGISRRAGCAGSALITMRRRGQARTRTSWITCGQCQRRRICRRSRRISGMRTGGAMQRGGTAHRRRVLALVLVLPHGGDLRRARARSRRRGSAGKSERSCPSGLLPAPLVLSPRPFWPPYRWKMAETRRKWDGVRCMIGQGSGNCIAPGCGRSLSPE